MPDEETVIELRTPKHDVNYERPYLQLHEQEPGTDGEIKQVNTIFLTNKECPFKCVMCDLWKHTLDEPTPAGAIPHQIEHALGQLPSASVVKLYNNGNFFDTKAIPPEDYKTIADLLSDYEHVIVENHPKLCNNNCVEFASMLNGSLEIAMGLETIHPKILPRLNKQITTQNFRESSSFLSDRNISVRAFLLLNPPYLTDQEKSIEWTLRSAEFAFECGATACSIIPTRTGNGFMEKLLKQGDYLPPTINALEEAFDLVMRLDAGRVFADIWDIRQFSSCDHCFEERKNRMKRMNLAQKALPHVACNDC